MSTPVLHVLAGPNGAGKSTLARRALQPVTGLGFINADEIAAARWPGQEAEHAYDASRAAADARAELLRQRRSFITETVFSHPSKVELVRRGVAEGYIVTLHIVLIPMELAVLRVAHRVALGGHAVPANKIRERYDRLWPLVAEARERAHHSVFYDSSRGGVFTEVARYQRGQLVGTAVWPRWTPEALR